MAKEIELKLALPESLQRSFLRHPSLSRASLRTSAQLVSIYYDTPDLHLRNSGVVVRVRRQGRAWLQTVKSAGVVAGGLSARPEWETPYQGHFDFSGVDDIAVRQLLEKRGTLKKLVPVFETSFRRTTWHFDSLMLMLDRGWIAADGRREAISEIELELTTGKIDDLFRLADELSAKQPLLPAPLSKAERGFRLYQHVVAGPARASTIALSPHLSPIEAFQRIALSCLDHMQQNHAGAAHSDDPEFIHQMRVATRRLRAALRLFAPVLQPLQAAPSGPTADTESAPHFATATLPGMLDMMGKLGAVRDLDVLLSEIAGPVSTALPDEPRLSALIGLLTEQRHAARQHVMRYLQSREFGQLMLHLAADLYAVPSPATTSDPGLGVTVEANADNIATFARLRLRKLRRKLKQLVLAARLDDPPSLHRLRIGIKRLRYAIEFFATLQPGKSQRRQVAWLAALQTTLGELNDLANAGQRLMACAGNDERLREAVTLIGGWHGPRHAKLMASLPNLLTKLQQMKP